MLRYGPYIANKSHCFSFILKINGHVDALRFKKCFCCLLLASCAGAAMREHWNSNQTSQSFYLRVWKDISDMKIKLSTCFLRWQLSVDGLMTHTAVIISEYHWSVTVESIHLSVTGMSCCLKLKSKLAELMMEVFARSPPVCWHVWETKAKTSQQWFQPNHQIYDTAIIKPSLAFSYSHVRPICISGPSFGSTGRRDPDANWPLEHIRSDQQTTSIPAQHFATYWDTVLHICFSLFSK